MTNQDKSRPLISVVVPALNEERHLAELATRIGRQFDSGKYELEILIVDDGSTDGSVALLHCLHECDPRVKAIVLSRNFGHQIALTAGLEHAAGAAVITMDADLQHPPELIPQLITAWEQGNEVVYTVRKHTAGVGLLKRWTSWFFYRVFNAISRTPIPAEAADFRLLDRRVVDAFCRLKEHARFIRGLVSWSGYRQAAIPFVADRRQQGTSRYSWLKMVRFGLDAITSFSSVPLRAATFLGFLSAIVGLPYALWGLYAHFILHTTQEGWTSLLIIMLFLGGIQLICLGVIGEYLGRIYEEVKGRPLYLERESIGLPRHGEMPATTSSAEKDSLETKSIKAAG